jgi:hypothetical protein
MPRVKKPPQSKLKGAKLALFQELEARVKDRPNRSQAAGQLRLLDIGIGDYTTRLPEVVAWMLDEAAPIDVASATARAAKAGISWQDMKATLELGVRLIRARALWESEDLEKANAELKQISASPSSRRNELLLEAASRTDASGQPRPEWSAGFSLALLRSSARAFSNSLPAGLSMVDALIGTGEMPAAALILGQLVPAWKELPQPIREGITERIGRLDPALRAPLEALARDI